MMVVKASPIMTVGCLLALGWIPLHASGEEGKPKDLNNKIDEQREGKDGPGKVSWNAKAADEKGSFLIVLVPAVTSADDLLIRVLVVNRNEKEFYCGENGYLPECILELTDSNGQKVPYSTTGKNLLTKYGGGGQRGERTYLRGQSKFWQCKLAGCFQPGSITPGAYTLSLRLKNLFTPPRSESSKGIRRRLGIEGLTFEVK